MITLKHICSLALIIFSCSAYSQSYPYEWVLFGEHTEKVSYDIEKEHHIHVDRNGDFYPNYKINDSDLRDKGDNQLLVWAEQYPLDFAKVAQVYNLEDESFSKTNFQTLQDSIVANISKSINHYAKEKSQTWLIHGYRKNMYQRADNIDYTSLSDNISVKKTINDYVTSNSKPLPYYVEVYWDGKYMFYNKKSVIKLAKMFKKAIPNAQNCGYALRDVFSKIKGRDINIISHSTGTHVATNLLFNVKKDFKYTKPTPNQNINLVLVASASSGKKLFKNYYDRETTYDFKNIDNYTIINAFNKKDNVLRLNLLYPFRASTKLGCDYHNASGKLLKYFSKNFIQSRFIEKSITYSGGAPHYFFNYVGDPCFVNVLKIIYE